MTPWVGRRRSGPSSRGSTRWCARTRYCVRCIRKTSSTPPSNGCGCSWSSTGAAPAAIPSSAATPGCGCGTRRSASARSSGTPGCATCTSRSPRSTQRPSTTSTARSCWPILRWPLTQWLTLPGDLLGISKIVPRATRKRAVRAKTPRAYDPEPQRHSGIDCAVLPLDLVVLRPGLLNTHLGLVPPLLSRSDEWSGSDTGTGGAFGLSSGQTGQADAVPGAPDSGVLVGLSCHRQGMIPPSLRDGTFWFLLAPPPGLAHAARYCTIVARQVFW